MRDEKTSRARNSADTGLLSRRSFVAATGAAMGSVAATALAEDKKPAAGVPASDNGAGDGIVLNSESAARVTWEFEIAPDPIDASLIAETYEADVVVVGAGAAGTFFAAAFGDEGGDCIVVSKSSIAMGRGGTIFAVNSSFMKSQGLEIDAEVTLKHEMFANSFNVDQDKWVRFFDHSGEAIDWMHRTLLDDKGWKPYLQRPFEDAQGVISHVMGSHGMGSDENPKLDELEVSGAMAEHAASKGVSFYYDTTAVQLVKDAGRVSGVICTNEDGDYLQFNARKAVIMATGDFTLDKEMMARYAAWTKDVPGGVETGDGHKMCLWAGAAWQRNAPVPMINNNLGLGNQTDGPFPGLVVNKLGKRFGNEDGNTVFQGIAQMRQPDMMNYAIFNEKLAKELTWYNYGVNRDLPAQTPEEVLAWWDGWVDEYEVTTYAGAPYVYCRKADTLEELCEAFDLSTDTVLETVSRYNEMASSGCDEDYHKNPDMMFAVDEGPYYMFASKPWNLVECGGIRCDEHMRALDADDRPVDGLYVLGMLVGDMYMSPYDFVCGGANLGSTCLTFGWLLAHELADGTLEG